MYNYRVVYQHKENGSHFVAHIVAFNKRDLLAQTMFKKPEGYKFVRYVTCVPGTRTDLRPVTHA